MDAVTNAKVTANVVHRNSAKISSVHRPAHNAVKVHNVVVCRIIGPFVSVPKDTLAVRTRNVDRNAMAIEIVQPVDRPAIMASARIRVTVRVVLAPIVICVV